MTQPPVDRKLGAPDYLLGVPAAPLLLFVLMFATSGMTDMLSRPASRRRFLAGLLVLEVLVVAVVVWLVAS